MDQLTSLLQAVDQDDDRAADKLLALVYEDLRRLAASKMAREAPGQTLQPTALVHEVWQRLAGSPNQRWENRRHFFAAAAESMRRILIDRARRKKVMANGGYAQREELRESMIVISAAPDEILAVHDALDQLADEDPDAAQLVKLRYFVGMTVPEAADALGMPLRSTERLWTFARAWLRHALEG